MQNMQRRDLGGREKRFRTASLQVINQKHDTLFKVKRVVPHCSIEKKTNIMVGQRILPLDDADAGSPDGVLERETE